MRKEERRGIPLLRLMILCMGMLVLFMCASLIEVSADDGTPTNTAIWVKDDGSEVSADSFAGIIKEINNAESDIQEKEEIFIMIDGSVPTTINDEEYKGLSEAIANKGIVLTLMGKNDEGNATDIIHRGEAGESGTSLMLNDAAMLLIENLTIDGDLTISGGMKTEVFITKCNITGETIIQNAKLCDIAGESSRTEDDSNWVYDTVFSGALKIYGNDSENRTTVRLNTIETNNIELEYTEDVEIEETVNNGQLRILNSHVEKLTSSDFKYEIDANSEDMESHDEDGAVYAKDSIIDYMYSCWISGNDYRSGYQGMNGIVATTTNQTDGMKVFKEMDNCLVCGNRYAIYADNTYVKFGRISGSNMVGKKSCIFLNGDDSEMQPSIDTLQYTYLFSIEDEVINGKGTVNIDVNTITEGDNEIGMVMNSLGQSVENFVAPEITTELEEGYIWRNNDDDRNLSQSDIYGGEQYPDYVMQLNGKKHYYLSNEYYISFDADGGTPGDDLQIVKYNETVNEPAKKPKKRNYKFVSWNLENSPYDFSTPVTEDIELKAVYRDMTPEELEVQAEQDNALEELDKIDTSQYEDDMKEAVEKAIEDGKDAIDDAETKEDVAKALQDTKDTIKAIEELGEAIKAAKDKIKDGEKGKYKDDTVKNLEEKIEAGEDALKEPTSKKEDYEKARKDIEDAVTNLKPKFGPGEDPNQMGSDGTAVGPGASSAAADKAITGMKSDSDPKGSKFAPLKLKSSKQGNKNIKLAWTKNKKAVKYVIYGNKCNVKKNKYKMVKLATVKNNALNVKKIKKTALKKGTYYKFVIVAIDKNNNVVSTSKVIHVATKGKVKKAANPTKVVVKSKVNAKGKKLKKWTVVKGVKMKAGKSVKLKVAAKKAKKTKVLKHRGVMYESSNAKIAKVSKKGVITGKKKGTAYVYAYAQNGLFKKIKVIVK